jgi:hypothetical protein
MNVNYPNGIADCVPTEIRLNGRCSCIPHKACRHLGQLRTIVGTGARSRIALLLARMMRALVTQPTTLRKVMQWNKQA